MEVKSEATTAGRDFARRFTNALVELQLQTGIYRRSRPTSGTGPRSTRTCAPHTFHASWIRATCSRWSSRRGARAPQAAGARHRRQPPVRARRLRPRISPGRGGDRIDRGDPGDPAGAYAGGAVRLPCHTLPQVSRGDRTDRDQWRRYRTQRKSSSAASLRARLVGGPNACSACYESLRQRRRRPNPATGAGDRRPPPGAELPPCRTTTDPRPLRPQMGDALLAALGVLLSVSALLRH